MQALTPQERRGALLVVALLLIGAAWDGWRAMRPEPFPAPVEPSGFQPDRTPAHGVTPVASASPGAPDTSLVGSGRLDLNRATVDQLDQLPGIGPVLARRIVEHRDRHGRFQRVEELRAVRGVGPRLLERIASRVRAGP